MTAELVKGYPNFGQNAMYPRTDLREATEPTFALARETINRAPAHGKMHTYSVCSGVVAWPATICLFFTTRATKVFDRTL